VVGIEVYGLCCIDVLIKKILGDALNESQPARVYKQKMQKNM
jgi:hypothetical protein